jgi:hypothetical protein
MKGYTYKKALSKASKVQVVHAFRRIEMQSFLLDEILKQRTFSLDPEYIYKTGLQCENIQSRKFEMTPESINEYYERICTLVEDGDTRKLKNVCSVCTMSSKIAKNPKWKTCSCKYCDSCIFLIPNVTIGCPICNVPYKLEEDDKDTLFDRKGIYENAFLTIAGKKYRPAIMLYDKKENGYGEPFKFDDVTYSRICTFAIRLKNIKQSLLSLLLEYSALIRDNFQFENFSQHFLALFPELSKITKSDCVEFLQEYDIVKFFVKTYNLVSIIAYPSEFR